MDDDYGDLQNPGSGYSGVQNPASPYGAKSGKPAAPKGKKPKPVEVTILASFGWRPAITEAKEIELLLNPQFNSRWWPGYQDYVAITGVTTKEPPGDLVALLAAIASYKPASIKRLNFWTHANDKAVGIAGYIQPDNVYFDSKATELELTQYAATNMSFTYKKKSFTLDEVRTRFTEDAIFVLYGCDIAFDPTTLLTAWKDLFQVTSIGFRKDMIFCPPRQRIGGTTFKRKGEKVGIRKDGFKCEVDATSDWRSLITDPNAVRVDK